MASRFKSFAILSSILLLMAGCTSAPSRGYLQATAITSTPEEKTIIENQLIQKDPPSKLSFDRIIIMPFKGDSDNTLSSDLAARLYSRGYRVISPHLVTEYLSTLSMEKRPGESRDTKLMHKYGANSFIKGSVEWQDHDLLIAQKRSISAKIEVSHEFKTVYSPDPYELSSHEVDSSILTGGFGSIAALAGFVWRNGTKFGDYQKSEQRRLYSMMLADKIARTFPLSMHTPSSSQWADHISLYIGGSAHVGRNSHLFGLGSDRQAITLYLQEEQSHPVPDQTILEARIGSKITIPLTVDDRSGVRKGRFTLSQKGLQIDNQPVEIYQKIDGEYFLVARKLLVSIDTVAPVINGIPSTFVENPNSLMIYFSVDHFNSGDEVVVESFIGGNWIAVPHLDVSVDSNSSMTLKVDNCLVEKNQQYRIKLSDQAGNVTYSKPFEVSRRSACHKVKFDYLTWRGAREGGELCIDPNRRVVSRNLCSQIDSVKWSAPVNGVPSTLQFLCKQDFNDVIERWQLRYSDSAISPGWSGKVSRSNKSVQFEMDAKLDAGGLLSCRQ